MTPDNPSTGGRYVLDPQTGQRTRQEDDAPPAAEPQTHDEEDVNDG